MLLRVYVRLCLNKVLRLYIRELDGHVASPSCPILLEQVVLELDGHVASPSCPTLLEQSIEVVLELGVRLCLSRVRLLFEQGV